MIPLGTILTCEVCGKKFVKKSNSQVYCSSECCKVASAQKKKLKWRAENKGVAEIGIEVLCENPKCSNTFIKKTGMHRFCSVQCRENAKCITTPKKKIKYKTINEVLEIMRNMGYKKSYGMFCVEYPELLREV